MSGLSNTFEKVNTRREWVDFRAVSDAAVSSLDLVVPQLLPDGYRSGSEWVARNPTRNDARPGSFKVNLNSGAWADFATGEKGGDAIDLIAYLEGKTKLDAARDLALLLNVPSGGSTTLTGNVPSIRSRTPAGIALTPTDAAKAPEVFSPRTPPDSESKPRYRAGDESPPVRDGEKRRHIYMQGGVPTRIKVINTDGASFNIYRVADTDGTLGWQYKKPEGFKAAPYVDTPSVFDALTLYWCEGEKDVETLAKLGLPAITFGGVGDGLPQGCAAYFIGKTVVILADNDEPGRKHAEHKAAAIQGMAASVRVVHFPELAEKGDVSDWIAAGNTCDDLLRRAAEAPEWSSIQVAGDGASDDGTTPNGEVEAAAPKAKSNAGDARGGELPYGYRFRSDGLFWSDPDDDDKPAIKLSGPFDIAAETRDGDGTSWGVLLEWRDRDGRLHRFAMPRSTLAGDGSDARRALLDGGLFVAPSQKARNLLNSFLLQVRSPNRARATQRIGWHDRAYVLPDASYGEASGDKLLLQTVTAHEHTFRQSGTLESWQQNVARYAVGNSRLVLALSAAFAGPLIGPCSAEGGGLHFRGASSTGKSTALHVAGSAWGGGSVGGFVRSWRATANGLEGVATAHSDALLCLDELSQLAARDAGEAAYMLGNGSGKARSARDGSARRAGSWRVLFLSSGEIGLSDKVAEDNRNRKLAAGQRVRVVDIEADAGAGMGLFEELHGFASADAFARHLREATQQHYGRAARAYLAEVVPAIDDLQKQVADIVAAFCNAYVPAGADGQVERVAQRFGLIAAGGEIATSLGVLPWPQGEATSAAGRVFESWICARGGSSPAEDREAIERVRTFLLANGQARFIPAWDSDVANHMPIRDVAGYRDRAGDGWNYYITPPAWREICAGLDPTRAAGALHAKGFLETGDGNHLARSTRIPSFGKQRVYRVLSALLEDAE